MIRKGYVDTSFGQIHYRYSGEKTNPPLLFLHQVPSNSVMYDVLIEKLNDRFYCIALDFPGFGGSEPLRSKTTIGRYAQAMHEALQALEIESCYVFGHHTGASVAVQLEYDYSGTAIKMALSGPTLLSDELKTLLPTKSYAFPVEENGSHFMGMWERVRAKDPDADLALSQREALIGISLGDTYPDAYQAVIDQDYAAQLPKIACPTLIFAGTNDPLYGQLDAALKLLPNGIKKEIEGARTYVCERNADQVEAFIAEFFTD